MMQFGDSNEFALEAESRSVGSGRHFGHLRFWIAGSSFGDFEETSDLGASARWGRQFLTATFRRTRSDLDSKNADEVYWKLYGRFFQLGATSSEHVLDRDPFVLDEVGESALRDRLSMLAVRRADGRDRILIRNHETGVTVEHVVPPGVCDRIIDRYCDWVESFRDTDG